MRGAPAAGEVVPKRRQSTLLNKLTMPCSDGSWAKILFQVIHASGLEKIPNDLTLFWPASITIWKLPVMAITALSLFSMAR